jgi:hypothetical protein
MKFSALLRITRGCEYSISFGKARFASVTCSKFWDFLNQRFPVIWRFFGMPGWFLTLAAETV